MKKKVLLALISIALTISSVTTAFAATGDVLAAVIEPLEYPVPNYPYSVVTGLDYDGSRVIYSQKWSSIISFTDFAGADLGSLQLINSDGTNVPFDKGPYTIAYNAEDGMLYGSGIYVAELYRIDLTTGLRTVVATNVIPDETWGSEITGMAWNPVDNTLWIANKNSCMAYNVDLNGNILASFNGCNVTGAGIIGLGFSLDGTMFYEGNDDVIYLLDVMTFTPTVEGTIIESYGYGSDLMVCGPKFTKADGTIVDTILSQHPRPTSFSPSPSPNPPSPLAYRNYFTVTEAPAVVCDVQSGEPTAGIITVSSDVVQLGAGVTASASFSNPDPADTHTALWDWGDGITSSGVVTQNATSGSVSGGHTYAAAGIYAVTLTVSDDDNNTSQAFYQYVAVYDPSGGYVTGAGWITSPAGAYPTDPSLTGKAHFGFVARYQRGASAPVGQTAFRFQAGDFSFQSEAYDWLVVAGSRAQFKGSGTVNGVSGYRFLLTLTDGDVNGGGGVDKFRIKIWNASGVVYDNMIGYSEGMDGANPQAIGAGNIVIHP